MALAFVLLFGVVNSTAATGGTITYDGDYKIHTFTSSGNFVVTSDGDVNVLVIAGGGGGSGADQAASTGTQGEVDCFV